MLNTNIGTKTHKCSKVKKLQPLKFLIERINLNALEIFQYFSVIWKLKEESLEFYCKHVIQFLAITTLSSQINPEKSCCSPVNTSLCVSRHTDGTLWNTNLICFPSCSVGCRQNNFGSAAHDLERKELIVKREEKRREEEDGKASL